MKKLLVAIGTIICASSLLAQSGTPQGEKPTPAQRGIARALAVTDKNSRDYEGFNALALALARRARETSDPGYYAQGQQALQKSFAISPGNYDGERIGVWLLLGNHEFAAALEKAITLNKRAPDDVMVWGFLADANAELGNYGDAEKAAQWMLNLRPGNLPAMTRAAYLRELFGDPDGALELMQMALDSTPPNELEDRAWITTQMAHLKLAQGRPNQADELLQQALAMFPGYHYALGNLAKVRVQQRRYEEAVVLLQTRYKDAPHAENLYDLAVALKKAGRTVEANKAFAEFERKSLGETGKADNSNHELIMYYADYAKEPVKALEVAQREYARRHDVFTLDCYAWALHVNGQDVTARKQLHMALAVGIQDATIFRHASQIAKKVGDEAAATKYSKLAAELEGESKTVASAR